MSSLPKHILVIRLSAMGDVAMIVPVLGALTAGYPDLKITVLTKAFFTPFFRHLPNVVFFEADVKGKHKGLFGLIKLSKELKTQEIDAIADLHNVLRSNVLKRLLPRPFVQINKGREDKKALVQGNFKPLKTTIQRYVEVFETLGFKIDLPRYNAPMSQPLSEMLLQLLGDRKKPMIGIAPFAAHKGKMYPLEKMKEVITQLSKDYKVLLFGGGIEEIAGLKRLEQIGDTISIAGKLTLDEELDLITNLKLMLSMDSGNAHIAAMLGIPVVSIWGVTHPYAGFAPFNQPEANSLLADRVQFPKIPTSIYGNKYPEGYEHAAGSISPKAIVDKVKEVLN